MVAAPFLELDLTSIKTDPTAEGELTVNMEHHFWRKSRETKEAPALAIPLLLSRN